MLSSKENVVFCNVFLSKISAKSLSKSFWQTKLKKIKIPQDIISRVQSVKALLPSLFLDLKDRGAILTHKLSGFSVLKNTNQKDKPVLTPTSISLPWVSSASFSTWLFLAMDMLLHPPRGRVPPSLHPAQPRE